MHLCLFVCVIVLCLCLWDVVIVVFVFVCICVCVFDCVCVSLVEYVFDDVCFAVFYGCHTKVVSSRINKGINK